MAAADATKLVQVFNSLNATNQEALEEGIATIEKIFREHATGIYLPEILPYIPVGLQHPHHKVRLLVLSLVENSLKHPGSGELFISSGLLDPVLHVPNDVSTGVATKAVNVLIELSRHPKGLQLLVSPQGPLAPLKTNNLPAEKRVRLLNLAAGIAAASPEGREAVHSGGFLGSLSRFAEVSHSDLLEALNLIAILDQLLETSHGVEYLQASGLLGSLAIESGFDPLLVVDLLRLYGKLLSKNPPSGKAWTDYPFLGLITSSLESDDPTIQEAAATAVGRVGSTASGVKLLEKQNHIWKTLGELVNSANQLLRNTVLHALSIIFEHRKIDEGAQESIFNEVSAATHPSLVNRLNYYLSTPFTDLRNVVFELQRNLALHTFGYRALFASPGYLEWLLNRGTEIEKFGAEWKYEIIKALILGHPNDNPSLKVLLGPENYDKLLAYLKQGVFYQKSVAGTVVADKTK